MKRSQLKQFTAVVTAGLILMGISVAAAGTSIGAGIEKTLLKSSALSLPAAVPTGPSEFAPGEVIVRYKKGITPKDVKPLATLAGVSGVKVFTALSHRGNGSYALVKGSVSTSALIKKFKNDPNVASVSPNYIRRLTAVPNDPDFTKQWGLQNIGQTVNGVTGTAGDDIGASAVWDTQTDSSDVVVAVFDTGVDYTHKDLAANMWHNPGETLDGNDTDGDGIVDDYYGADFGTGGTPTGDPMDEMGHGTHVAGIIGAVGDNGIGVSGVNWKVKIMACKVFRPDGYAYDSDILNAIDYVLAKKAAGVNIVAINASYAGYGGSQSDPMNGAIQSLGDAGIMFCAAASNEANNNDVNASFPASYSASNIISVAASDQSDNLADFSNYGVKTVDLAAPGVNIYSTIPGDAYTPSASDLFYENFDSGTLAWETNSTQKQWGLSTQEYVSPSYSLADSPVGGYANDTYSYILSPSMDLSSATGFVDLGFKMKMNLETGKDTLTLIGVPDCTPPYYYYPLETYSEENQPWASYSVMLPEEVKTSNFCFGFILQTDSQNTFNGVYIDNIGINPVTTTASDSYGYMSGTSMATPMVTGSVAMLASLYPSESVSELKNRILRSVDISASLKGKVSSSGRLNLDRAVRGDFNPPPKDTPVFDKISFLLSILGFLAVGGLIARRKLAERA